MAYLSSICLAIFEYMVENAACFSVLFAETSLGNDILDLNKSILDIHTTRHLVKLLDIRVVC